MLVPRINNEYRYKFIFGAFYEKLVSYFSDKLQVFDFYNYHGTFLSIEIFESMEDEYVVEGHAILGQNVSYWKIPKNYSGIYVFKPVLKVFNGLKQITWYWKSIEEIKRYWKSIEMIAMVLKVFNGIE